MGEIKSTLDLVMEKTRHLTMSKEEREAQHAAEIRKTLRGLLQKYRDGRISKDRFQEKFRGLEEVEQPSKATILREEILNRIVLEGEAEVLLELLASVCGAPVESLASVLQEFVFQRDAAVTEWSRTAKEKLEKERGISGSAVVPNPEGDSMLEERLRALRETYDKRLRKEKTKLLA